jgi:hypothetical protein
MSVQGVRWNWENGCQITNWKRFLRNWSWRNLKYFRWCILWRYLRLGCMASNDRTGTSLKGLRKINKSFSQYSRSPSRGSNQTSPKYECRALPIRQFARPLFGATEKYHGKAQSSNLNLDRDPNPRRPKYHSLECDILAGWSKFNSRIPTEVYLNLRKR